MLTRLSHDRGGSEKTLSVRIADAKFPAPFSSGLEYCSPARGSWNIAHTGMLVPEAHEVFVCAEGCLRGVVLTAAEQGTIDRFSMITVEENNLLDGDMETLIVDGIGVILKKLPYQPKAMLIYTSCVHHFAGCDLKLVYKRLKERYPEIDFVDCYMNPIMRKSGLTPDQLMRRGMYRLIRPREIDPKRVNIIGNDFATDKESELVRLIGKNGYRLREIQDCKTYDEYQELGSAAINVLYNPSAIPAGEQMQQRLGGKAVYLTNSFDCGEIEAALHSLSDALGVPREDYAQEKEECEQALGKLKELLGDTPAAIDYTVHYRPLSLAKMLLTHGMGVRAVFLDGISGEEKEDFLFLQKEFPDLLLCPTIAPGMRYIHDVDERILAIGQKAAYITGSRHFVNVVECGGMFGFEGILRMCREIEDAFLHEKDMKTLIQIKGLGGGCCL